MNRRGVSMIEVVMAMFLVAVLVLSLVELNRSSNRTMMDTHYQLLA